MQYIEFHEEKCIACGNCFMVCPDVAITVYKLEGGSDA